MHIYIPSMNRWNEPFTIDALIGAGIQNFWPITIVVPDGQQGEYEKFTMQSGKGIDVYGLPVTFHIAETRQWIIDSSSHDFILMMDDDLTFFVRPELDEVTLVQSAPEDIKNMLVWIENALQEYAHVSISTREQNFQNSKYLEDKALIDTPSPNDWVLECRRPYRIYGFDRQIILGEELKFGTSAEINTMDDFHITLSLIELGYLNAVNFKWAHNQRGSNTKGGASCYRDLNVLQKSAEALQAAHPSVVKLVDKETISSWGGTSTNPTHRTDVRIQWQKALGIRASERKIK